MTERRTHPVICISRILLGGYAYTNVFEKKGGKSHAYE